MTQNGSVFETKKLCGSEPSAVKTPKHLARKYDAEYIKFGFIIAGSDAEPKAQCFDCGEILSNEALKTSKLKRRQWTHCFLHSENLATNHMPPELYEVMNVAVNTVNYINKTANCLAALCERLDADHLQILYQREVRWLSRGRVLNHLSEWRKRSTHICGRAALPSC